MATTGKLDLRTTAVLSSATSTALKDFVVQARSPAAAKTVLVVGDATAVAQAASTVASGLGREVLRVSLAAVASKYIGETEKNLDRAFETAKAGRVVLFFDEADALFGKRTGVQDSHDRYANLEVGALLQRIEASGAVAVIATNRKQDIDAAMMRRLRYVPIDPPK